MKKLKKEANNERKNKNKGKIWKRERGKNKRRWKKVS